MSDYRPPERIPGQNGRWVARDKELVVNQIVAGTMTAEQAMDRYQISEDELISWTQRLRRHGRNGLRVKTTQTLPR